MLAGGEVRRRGKRRRKGRAGGSDRLTSAGLAAQAQQDPETQVNIEKIYSKLAARTHFLPLKLIFIL